MGKQLLISSHPCDQCLTTRNRIVPAKRAAEIIKSCRANDNHFQCHKGTIAGQDIHCRGVHDAIGPSKLYRFASWLGIPIVEVDVGRLAQGTCAAEGETTSPICTKTPPSQSGGRHE